ncbi:hypothetical protein N8739_01530 [Luminiphilus sp.]|nr:hypothetical protein [Luminiphilus sp.]
MAQDRFDWTLSLTLPLLTERADHAVAVIEASDSKDAKGASKKGRRDQRGVIMRQVISALYIAYVSDDLVSFPLREKNYSAKKPKPGKIHFSYTYTKEAYDTLKRLGWLEVAEPPRDGKHTRVRASGDLATVFSELGLVWSPQELKSQDQLVQLRDVERDSNGTPIRKGKPPKTRKYDCEVPDSPKVEGMRERLERINSFLTQHCFHLDLSDQNIGELQRIMKGRPGEDDGDPKLLRLHDVQLRRVFARGSMEKGGRFYGGWWQGIPELHRPHIRIDGYKTIEVDYSGIAIRIISAQLGKPLPADVDPYDIGLRDWHGSDDPRRKKVKKIVNALINDEDGVYRLPKDTESVLGVDEAAFKDHLHRTHPLICEQLATGIGLQAQYIDSEVAERVMLRMMEQDVVVLPIHDSFCIRLGYRQSLEIVMKDVFAELIGAEVSVDAAYSKSDNYFGLKRQDIEDQIDALDDETERMGVISADKLFSKLENRQSDIMDDFLGSWESWRAETR